jgi:tRNA threonylcarbamoyladenosine modification (KEOPS) complex Cgi121 subunit
VTEETEATGYPDLSIAGARLKRNGSEEVDRILDELRSTATHRDLLQMFDARAVASLRHVVSAFVHTRRSLEEGRARLKDPGAIMAIYMAGMDQLDRALERVGLRDDTSEIVIAASPARDLDRLIKDIGLTVAHEVIPVMPSAETMKRLGVEEREYLPLVQDKWELIILENVAAVDLKS